MARVILALIILVMVPSVAMAAPNASRTSGVAPLYVHFDADAAASTPGSRPFHELEYEWNYGDANSGAWSTSGKSKNTDKGASAAHVYETPGTYTATLTVRNPNTGATTSTSSFEITVQDPNSVFSGTNTTCISTTSDFTGCPAGANTVTSANLNTAMPGYADAGERILLKRGDTWSITSEISLAENHGPVLIGAFGACTSPDVQGSCSNAPTINVAGAIGAIRMDRKRDWRVLDINFEGDWTIAGTVMNGDYDLRDWLFLRIKANHFDAGVGWYHARLNDSQYNDKLAIVSCTVTDSRTNGAYLGGERIAYMGNINSITDNSHILRVWQGYKAVINHNRLSGCSQNTVDGRQALKLHGPRRPGSIGTSAAVGDYSTTGSSGLRYYTQFAVVSNNTFGSCAPWPVSIGPQNTANGEEISDVLFEKNRIVNDYDDASAYGDQNVGLRTSGRYYTIRNNVFNGTGTGGSYRGIFLEWNGVDWLTDVSPTGPLGHRVYNNTVYYNGVAQNGAYGIEITSNNSDIIVRNNYISLNNTGSKTAVSDLSGVATASNNPQTTTPNFVDPLNSNPLLRNFSITSSAVAAIDLGSVVPVRDDYLGNIRPFNGTFDIGSFEYGATGGESGVIYKTCYKDVDNDLYSDGVSAIVDEELACPGNYYISSRFTALSGDCNDADANINPGGVDICGNTDRNCDTVIDPCVTNRVRWGTGTVGWGAGSVGQ